ncbi:hypothetical protein JCM1841_004351 [Sporobolomyces salmonicolor]
MPLADDSSRTQEDGTELEQHARAFTREEKGKGRSIGGNDTVHELDDDDDEVEGLLRKSSDSSPPEISGDESRPGNGSRRRRHSATDLAKAMATGRGGLIGRALGGMTSSQRKLFLREMLVETLPVLLLSMVGAVLTGELLQRLQGWRVFIRIEELFILVPILLNLKGNLEMNLAARFSTSANIGELDLRLTRRALILGNLALLQVQALLVSLISGLLAFLLGLASRKGVHHALQHPIHSPGSPLNQEAGGSDATDALRGGYFEALLVLCVSMLAASISSGVLGSFMCSLVVLCRRFRINPDNIATPLAGMLGDLVTLVILGIFSSLFAKFMGTIISTFVFIGLLAAIAVNIVITFRNAYVQELLSVGWGPLFIAMAISSGSGVILESYVNAYRGFALLSPVLTALSGAAGSVFVSRISTALHSGRREHYFVVGACLWTLTCAVLGVFLLFAWATGQGPRGWVFGGAYIVVVAVQTGLSLILAHRGSLLLWKLDYDPDVYALPLLSSVLDVSGQLLLVAAYAIANKFSSDSAAAEIAGGAAANVTMGARWV